MRISDWSSDVCSSDLPVWSTTPVLGPVSAGGNSLTFLEQATAAVQSTAVNNTRLMVFISSNPLRCRGIAETSVKLRGQGVQGASSLRAERHPGRLAAVAVGEHQSLAPAALGRDRTSNRTGWGQ